MKILLGYSYYKNSIDIKEWVENWISRLNISHLNDDCIIEAYPLTINPPGPCLNWDQLDRMWKYGDRKLFSLYEDLTNKLYRENFDVFINWNGINIHPELVKALPTFNVYSCFDDPESSEILSKPVAKYYDMCLVGNIAEVNNYFKWGVKNAFYWPLGFRQDDYNSKLTEDNILNGKRDIDIALLCERQSGWRAQRLNNYVAALPGGAYFGKGWPKGYWPEDRRIELYQRTKIGPNFHNSTGPVNFRTFILPANGVMQICDNKSHLAKLFKLGEEIVGFDSVEEAIELTRYYLDHEEERLRIAIAGWKRAINDYNEQAVFKLAVNYIRTVKDEHPILQRKNTTPVLLSEKQRQRTSITQVYYYFELLFINIKELLKRQIRRILCGKIPNA